MIIKDKPDIGIILQLAYEVSTTTKADVMVNYYGHTNSISISIRPNGWVEDDENVEWTIIWINDEPEKLEEMANKLEGMLKNGMV